MYAHPIAAMVRAHLTGSRVWHMPTIPRADLYEAVARYGSGLDHAGGEVPLALVQYKFDSQAVARGYSLNYVVTDRRLFGRGEASNIPRTFTEVPYAQVTGLPDKPGGMSQSVLLQLGPQSRKLYAAPRELYAFFSAMLMTLPPASRGYGLPLVPVPSAEDVLGAWAASQLVGDYDARTWVPLRALFEAQRRGQVDPGEAARLVQPMMVLARGVSYGRGGSPLGWVSTLPAPVLSLALRATLGEPSAGYPGPTGEVLDFFVGGGSGKTGAGVSTAVGLALFATVGFGWISHSHGFPLASIRVQSTEAPGGSAFLLLGTSGAAWDALNLHWWRAVDVIHQGLFRLEARYLLAQVLFGPREPAVDLLSIPRDMLEAHVAPLIGPTDLSVFYPT